MKFGVCAYDCNYDCDCDSDSDSDSDSMIERVCVLLAPTNQENMVSDQKGVLS